MEAVNAQLEKYHSVLRKINLHISNNFINNIYINPKLTEVEKYYYTLLFKTNNTLDTANILFYNIINKPNISDSICIILRATLSDLITYEYLNFISKDENELETNINRLYFDHVERTIKNVTNIFKPAYKKTEKEIQEKINSLKIKKSKYFDSLGNPLYKSLNFGVISGVNYILSNKKKDQNVSRVTIAFNYFDIFSKYEHLGDLTFSLIHRQFDEEKLRGLLIEIQNSITIILDYLKEIILKFETIESDSYHSFLVLTEKLFKIDFN